MTVATRRSKAPKKTFKKAPSRPRAPAKTITPPPPPRSARPRRNKPVVPKTPSPGTLSPSVIEKTDIKALSYRDQVLELKGRLAEYEHDRHKQYRIHKSRSRRHHRHRRHYSFESSIDSEEGDGLRVSFMHAEDTRPFLNLHERYRSVEIKYFKQIFFGTFKSENLTKLGRGYVNRAGTDGAHEANGMMHLLQCFEVYGQAICHYAHPTVAIRLQKALSDYRFRLAELSASYKFDSIREYHGAFMNARILNGQDDPSAWIIEDRRCSDLLLRKMVAPSGTKQNLGSAPKSSSSGLGIYRNFNEGRCSREHCKYSYICLNCQLNHAANTCYKAQTGASSTNLTPLGNRISKPE